MTKGAQDKQVSRAMPEAAVSIHPHGLWSLDSTAEGTILSLKVLLCPPVNVSRTLEICSCLLRV